MTGSASATQELFVEGSDDEHAIGHLLVRRGVDPLVLPAFKESGSKKGVLRAVRVGVRAATGGSVGFVLDSNDDPQATWKSVVSRLRDVGVETPTAIPGGGFAGESKDYGTRVGVWLMPDNRRTGALEAFLQDLIDEGDPLLPLAEEATRRAKELGSTIWRHRRTESGSPHLAGMAEGAWPPVRSGDQGPLFWGRKCRCGSVRHLVRAGVRRRPQRVKGHAGSPRESQTLGRASNVIFS